MAFRELLNQHRKALVLPFIAVLILFVILLVLSKGAEVVPFIYSVFCIMRSADASLQRIG